MFGLQFGKCFFIFFNHKDATIGNTDSSSWLQCSNKPSAHDVWWCQECRAKDRGQDIYQEILSLKLFNNQRCNTLWWPILHDTSPSQFWFISTMFAFMYSTTQHRELPCVVKEWWCSAVYRPDVCSLWLYYESQVRVSPKNIQFTSLFPSKAQT